MTQRELAGAAGVPSSTVATIEFGRRQPSVELLERLLDAAGFHLETRLVNTVRPARLLSKQRRDDLVRSFAQYPIAQVWIFGSVARGDDGPDSDLDLLVELKPGASVVDILGLDDQVSHLFGCPVDIVTTAELESNDLLRRGVVRHRRRFTGAA